MFKRVERRLKRKEREDELGLDQDAKEVLGLNDTDSDESESDVDSDSHGDIPDADSDDDEVDAEEELDLDLDGGSDEETGLDDEVDHPSEERALITIAEALTNPIFLVSLDPTVHECIVCPGKQLKTQVMVETHKKSNAHGRRFKQFENLVLNTDTSSIAHDFVETHMSNKQPQLVTNSATSKRAEKKRISQEKRKAKREKFKARQKAKKEALAKSSSATTSKKGENEAVKSVGKETIEEEEQNVLRSDEDKPKKHKKRGETASEAVKTSKHNKSDPLAPPPKKNPKASKSTDAKPTPTATAAVTDFDFSSSKKLQPSPRIPKRISEDVGDKPQKKHKKKKNDTASEILKPSEHTIPVPSPSSPSPKKKRKLDPTTAKPQAPNQNSKSAPTLTPAPTTESPKIISELQSQVKDIIKSASDLARAARARALNGGDNSDDETKSSATKKMKKKAVTTKRVQKS